MTRTAYRVVPGLRASLLLDEEARAGGRSLVEVVLEAAREADVRTVAVTKGTSGFGRRRVIQTSTVELLAAHLPLWIELVDEPERVERLVTRLGPMLEAGLLTVEPTAFIVPARQRAGRGG